MNWRKFIIEQLLRLINEILKNLPAEATKEGGKEAKLAENLTGAKGKLEEALKCCD